MTAGGSPERDPEGCAAFFEMAADHLCVAGFDGYWKKLNPAWSRTLGWTDEELMAVPLIEFVHPDDRDTVLAARRGLEGGKPLLQLANRYRCKDGSYRWFEWRSSSDVSRQLVYAIARDVTQARETHERLQRQLMHADRMASVGTLAAGVAHEINNPLAYVVANLELIQEELRAAASALRPELLGEWLGMIGAAREGSERIRKIVRALKSFAHDGAERRTILDVRAVLERSIDIAANEIRHRARLVKELGPVPPVDADDARLGQVFLNLLVNAAQAIDTGSVDDHEIRITTATDERGRAVIEVHDTGRGIPPGVLDRMFEPFFTTKPVGVGTGLGLAICHNVVTGLGGEITATNHAGRGAYLRIALPAAPPIAEVPAAAGVGRANGARRATVLVVDDERAIGDTLARLLRGHDVRAVTSAREALELLAGGARFDVILSDLMMPGMSGMELHAEVARRWPELAPRVVFITGGAFTEGAKQFLDRVPNERLEKPFSMAEVRALIERLAAA